MKGAGELREGNLLLRPLEERDIETLRLWRNQEEIRRWFLESGPISPQQQQEWFRKYQQTPNDFMFILEKEGQAVGSIALYRIDEEKKTAELGRLIVGEPQARGAGLGRRATQLLCRFAFEELGLASVVLEVFEENLPAKQSYLRVGFSQEALHVRNGRTVCAMRLRQEDWLRCARQEVR